MTKETLLEILKVSNEKDIPEKDAALIVVGKRMCLNWYKKKYGIERYKPGESKYSHRERQCKLNDNYFENYTLQNCYYAGFIAADGNIDKDKRKLTIGLSMKDISFLELFRENIDSDYRIYTGVTRNEFYNASLSILSPKICSDLEKNFNITPQKSLTLLPPNIENVDFLDAFIVGLIDGDGTISTTKKTLKDGRNSDRFYISIIGTKEMLTMVKNRFENIVGRSVSELHHKHYTGNTYTIRVSDKTARTLFEHFYKINVPKLERKWSKEMHERCLNYTKNLPICRRKGVNVLNLQGQFIRHFDTLLEASKFTNVSFTAISKICKFNDNKHMGNGFMFSRTKTEMEPYVAVNPFSKKRLKELENLK